MEPNLLTCPNKPPLSGFDSDPVRSLISILGLISSVKLFRAVSNAAVTPRAFRQVMMD